MKILYGVQGTGNGHIARARVMARAFERHRADVDYLLSGRDRSQLFGTALFGDFALRRGLTFVVENGAIDYWKTTVKLPLAQALKDIVGLDVREYDLVISDFEPITAWAAFARRIPSLGISHQAAFRFPVPKEGQNPIAVAVMKSFAPVKFPIGLHWDSFGLPILPPLIDVEDVDAGSQVVPNQVLVYLPFENVEQVIACLSACPDYEFVVYMGTDPSRSRGNIRFRGYDKTSFHLDLLASAGVICNAGFELPSECIHLGKRILVKPVAGQMEQLSNARALEELGLGARFNDLHADRIAAWFESSIPKRRDFGNVAEHIVPWLLKGDYRDVASLAESAWREARWIES